MPTQCSPEPMLFARLDRRDLVADFGGGAINLIDRFAACFIWRRGR